MPLDKSTLLKKSIAKAVQSPANLVSGAVCLAASAVTWNPLPLIIWGLAATGWVSLAATGDRYIKQIEDEERRQRELKAEKDRDLLRQKVELLLAENPVAGWTRSGLLPDYLGVYRRLAEIRGRVTKVLSERSDLDAVTKAGLLEQLGYMLTAYLNFVRERISYLQILANIRPSADGEAQPVPPPPPQSGRRDPRLQAVRPLPPAAPLPKVEKRLADVDA